MRKLTILLLAAFALAAFPSGFCAAQQMQAARMRVPAWVVISPELEWTGFRLARFAGNAPHDVILLAPNADAATLTEAVEALLAARREAGDIPAADALLRAQRTAQTSRILPWAGRVLQDARAAPPRQVPGVGRVRAVRIWLPAQRPGEHGAES